MVVLYRDLRHRAAACLRRRERKDDTPQPTALVDAALTRLAALDRRTRDLVGFRFFAGLSLEEASEALGISRATAERHWKIARAWLLKELR